MATLSPAAIFASATRQVITKYVNVANFVILVVDYLATLPSEISLMWSSKWSAAKVLFFLTRYLALIDVPTGIYCIPPKAVHVAEFVVFFKFLGGLEYGASLLPTVIGCMPLPPKSKDANTFLSILFGLILANELSVMIMTLIIGLIKYNDLRSPLVKIFYRDGFFYFLILSAISAGNITADLVGPPEYRFLIVL
ncbi:hypothetical protein EST38_g7880 [Candolleomyces aberdarensis]|uniref:DUF6533 domain-containing protein n=1 Tax=Candolleomyces aberdarensis TaxID=2316362 RepID=A0A4Q2DE15_9AGAR|nr:hypothetical protein EST38_g7880 [Candolleomyces aberdarensis]